MAADKTPPEKGAATEKEPTPAPAPARPAKPIDQAVHGRVRKPHGGTQKE